MNAPDLTPSPVPSTSASPGVYIPGHSKRKLMMILYGAILFALGFSQLWTPLYLVACGKHAKAEAISVTKTKEGLPDLVLTDDLQIQSKLESQDRSYVFWNEFRFHTADGRTVEVRAPIGSLLKPLYTLVDADGLPTTDLVCYDPSQPHNVVFPLVVSTWFAPGVLVFAGLVCIILGAFLFYWSKKPIELPHIQFLSSCL